MTEKPTETWLKRNRRALWVGLVLAALVGLSGVGLTCAGVPHVVKTGLGLALIGTGVCSSVVLLRRITLPRIGYRDEQLLVYLTGVRPISVPIEIVECFFLGEAAAGVPGLRSPEPRVSAVAVRLAESAQDWADRDVTPALGRWADGYITIRGTWCEPLNIERVNQLNSRLREAHRECRDRSAP